MADGDDMSGRNDDELEQLEERLTALYANAENELRAKYNDFSAAFEKDDKRKREQVDQGLISEDEYTAWRKTQILKSNQYTKAVESMTNMLVETDVAAMAIVNGTLPQVVAQSYDFVQALGYESARNSGLTAGTFQIYNAQTVQALIRDNPDLMPAPQVDIPLDKKWNKDRINREITQGILQGESIPDIATRLMAVTTMDRNAAIRNARTAMTGAENLGRYESAQDLREQGIPVEEVWSAASDDRTRESHRLLDGTTRDESGYFGVGIIATPLRFAGDPNGDPEEVYNCRCRTGIVLQGVDHSKDKDIYEDFMRQFEGGQDVLEGKAPETKAQSQHQGPEVKTIGEIQPELAPIRAEGITAEEHEISEGKDISLQISMREDREELTIYDILHEQGFDKTPQMAGPEEFENAVKQSNFIAQRTYSGEDKATLDERIEQFHNGDIYVSGNRSAFGQGIYLVSSEGTEITEGMKEDIQMYSFGAYNHTDTMTLTPDAKIAEYEDLQNELIAIGDRYYEIDKDSADTEYWNNMNLGEYAAMKGYDAIHVGKDDTETNADYTVVLNRSKMIILDERKRRS